jgi:peptidoglycan/LPS O-acetylase OafA/YrhL
MKLALADLRSRPLGNVPCLDILRSAAILLVFSGHVAVDFGGLAIAKSPFVYWGWTGVDLFFILSGYLIGGQLWKELNRTGSIRVGRFILRRGFRIWPLYYSFLLLALITNLIRSQPLTGFGFDLFFLSNYVGKTNVGGSWSLCIEEQFYIAFPLILWLGNRFVSVKHLAWIAAAWLVALPLFRARSFHLHQTVDGFLFQSHSDGLAIGLLIAWFVVFCPQWVRTPLRNNALVAGGLVVLAALLYQASRPIFNYSSIALLYGSCTLFLLRLPNPPAWFTWSGFYVISRLSYGIYLNHFLVLDYLPKAIMPYIGKGTMGFLLCWIICLLVSGFVAFLTFAVIELPFLRLRESVYPPSKQRSRIENTAPVRI